MLELEKSKGAGSVEMEILTVLIVLVVICAAAMPIYKYYVVKPYTKEAPQILSEIISYIQDYRQKHDGKWPPGNCDTRAKNREWIDYVLTKMQKSSYFSFYYVVGPNGNVYVSAVGHESPFTDKDKLTFYFATNTWHGTGYLEGLEPE